MEKSNTLSIQLDYANQPQPSFSYLSDVYKSEGVDVWGWDISDDELARLTTLLGHDFEEANVGSTYVTCPPRRCPVCQKWTEFIDWVWTAIHRKVHTPGFIFESLKARKQGQELAHDVYCSGCGTLTQLRASGNVEGVAPNIWAAGPLDRERYERLKSSMNQKYSPQHKTSKHSKKKGKKGAA